MFSAGIYLFISLQLTHFPLGRMAAISQTTFANAFSKPLHELMLLQFTDAYMWHCTRGRWVNELVLQKLATWRVSGHAATILPMMNWAKQWELICVYRYTFIVTSQKMLRPILLLRSLWLRMFCIHTFTKDIRIHVFPIHIIRTCGSNGEWGVNGC